MATWPKLDFDTRARLDFDEAGPSFRGVWLLRKSRETFASKSSVELELELLQATGRRYDCSVLALRLDVVRRALDQGDIGKAAITAQFIDPPPPIGDDSGQMGKASVDDPKHPGWPRGAPDGKGGEFRPKDDAGFLTVEDKGKRIARLRQRRSFRAILRRVLTAKRAARIIGEWAGDLAPGIDAVAGAASVIDDMQLLRDIADEVSGSQAALDFAEHGPFDLSDLLVSSDDASFSSYDAFYKFDVDLEKLFGPAGEGYQYHHIVEQGPNAAVFSQEMLQSTSNIIRIPTIVHEDINAIFAKSMEFTTGYMPLRDFLRGASYEQQRAWGLWALEQIGTLNK